jgi:hypothetical protein
MDAMPAWRRSVVHMMSLRHIRDRMLSGCASHIDAEAVAPIVTDETVPISARCIWPLIGF